MPPRVAGRLFAGAPSVPGLINLPFLQAALKSYLYRLTAYREDAEDLAQEVWIGVFTRLGSFEGQSSVRTWLFAIASQVAMDHPRVKARWPVDAQDKAKAL